MSNICVIGTGYVGLPTGACFADLGNNVTCVDIDIAKIESLRRGILPIYEPGLEELIERNVQSGRLRFTSSYEEGVKGANFIFIAVGTPQDEDGSADMKYVSAAAESIGPYLTDYTVIINKSTVPIGTGDKVARIIAEAAPGAKFAVISNPEFVREGSAVHDFMQPDRIVLGATDREAAELVAELYAPLRAPILITDLRSAEMIKYASNAMLATRISFMNEMSQICEQLGADVTIVAKGMGYDKRIGPEFLNAGVGFGGSCFPKDVKALAYQAAHRELHPQLLRAVMDINVDQRRYFVSKARKMLGGDLSGKNIAVWGLAFKPNTDDMREAPSIDIIRWLMADGAKVLAYDPVAMQVARRILPSIGYGTDLYEVVKEADAVLLVTGWNEFKQADLKRVKSLMRQPILLDGANIYDPADVRALGFTYSGMGRN